MISLKHWSLAAVLALFMPLAGCTSHASAEAPPEVKPPEGEAWLTEQQLRDSHIQLALAGVQPVQSPLLLGGKVAFDDLRVTHVFSPVTGRVTQVFAQPGQKVKKGAPLVAIASPDVGNTFSDIVKAQADLEAAQHDYLRQQELFREHAGSQRDLETAEDTFRKAQAEQERAGQKARLLSSGSVDRVTQEYTLRAPIDGAVVARNVNLGMEVQGQYTGGNSAELFTIGDLNEVWMMADVHEMDLARVQPGSAVSVQLVAYPGQHFEGKVDWVSDVLDPTQHTAKVRCVLPNPERKLKPEMYATASVTTPGQQALTVPRRSVLRLGDQTMIFVGKGKTEDGRVRFERRPVQVDEDVGGEQAPVLRGVEPGETVVTNGAILLSEMT